MNKVLMVAITLLALTSCTEQDRARHYGGTESVKLAPQERFINATWKGTDLWIVVQDTTTGVFYMKENSALGVLEGKIIFSK